MVPEAPESTQTGNEELRLPYLVLGPPPPGGFASPFRLPRDIEERWFRPGGPR